MLYGLLHTALFTYLHSAGIRVQPYAHAATITHEDVLFISSFSGNGHRPYQGIQSTQQLRLSGCTNHIFFLSFLQRSQTSAHDYYNVLALPATSFLQLPVPKEKLADVLQLRCEVPEDVLNNFRFTACKKMLFEKIRMFNHKAGFGDRLFRPLAYACYGDNSSPQTNTNISNAIRQIQHELSKQEVADFIQAASYFPKSHFAQADEMFVKLLQFANAIKNYSAFINELSEQEESQVEPGKVMASIDNNFYPKYDLIKQL